MTDLKPEDAGYILLPETAAEVPEFLKRTDFTKAQAARLGVLVSYLTEATKKSLQPMIVGSNIEVFARGDWVRGTIANVHKGGLLEVETEKGPVSAYAKSTHVRWPQTSI